MAQGVAGCGAESERWPTNCLCCRIGGTVMIRLWRRWSERRARLRAEKEQRAKDNIRALM